VAQHRHRSDPTKSLVAFSVGGVRYAVAIATVREICNPLPLVELPRAPLAVDGVADYRGEVIPVIDLRTRFGLPRAPPTRRTKWLVVDTGGRSLALVVDQALGVTGTAAGGIRPSPPLGAGDELRGIEGVVKQPDGLLFVLDPRPLRELTAPLAADAAALAALASGEGS
jgi:purine-binding chemotaxis protein CheW